MNISNKSTNNFDPIDNMVFEENLRIQKIFFDLELDLMLIVLNNKKVLKESISNYKLLKGATIGQLNQYQISRTGVHWEDLNEDLSLRGFLKSAMKSSISQNLHAVM